VMIEKAIEFGKPGAHRRQLGKPRRRADGANE
jgi:hypothetical protein